MFLVDSIIHMTNAIVSANKALYLWSMNQQKSSSLVDKNSNAELSFSVSCLSRSVSAVIAQNLNLLFSIVSLITRLTSATIMPMINHGTNTEGFVMRSGVFMLRRLNLSVMLYVWQTAAVFFALAGLITKRARRACAFVMLISAVCATVQSVSGGVR